MMAYFTPSLVYVKQFGLGGPAPVSFAAEPRPWLCKGNPGQEAEGRQGLAEAAVGRAAVGLLAARPGTPLLRQGGRRGPHAERTALEVGTGKVWQANLAGEMRTSSEW
jgi:hypothetical protein